MTNSKTTKRALFSSVVALLLCFTMLLGTTFAWFTDTASSGSNVIKSGNLDIEVTYTLGDKDEEGNLKWANLDGAEDLFQKGLWEPGHTEVVVLKIENKGSLALKYTANMNIVDEETGLTKADKDGKQQEIKLSDHLKVSTMIQQANAIGDIYVSSVFANENAFYTNTDLPFTSSILGEETELFVGGAHYVAVKVDMPETVGNEANHNGVNVPTINFGINVLATQYTEETDSFGNQYDKNAEYPVIPEGDPVATFNDLKNAMNNGGEFYLAEDITITAEDAFFYGDYITAVYNDTVLDLNGHTITVDAERGDTLFYVYAAGASLTVKGDGNIIAKNDAFIFFPRSVSEGLYIYGGNYYNVDATSGTQNDMNAIVYTQMNNNIHIYGGTFTFKNVGSCGGFNVYDNGGGEIILYEGVLLSNSNYYKGSDGDEIHLAEGCTLKEVVIDGVTWYQVVKE